MAELLASSSTINDENELVSKKSSQNETISSEITSINSLGLPSKLFHKRIVNVLETFKKPNDNSSKLPLTSSHIEHKSQPITFGQLRQATISSVSTTIIEDESTSHQITKDIEEKNHKILPSYIWRW